MIKLSKLFQKNNPNEDVISEPAKTLNGVIEEIHETFYAEVDKLLAEAKIAHSLDTDKKDLIDKCARLKALGFTNTKEVKEAEAEIKRLNKLKRDNEAKEQLIDAINYFSAKYPKYKFITEESVEKICAKYNLVYGPIDRYIGTVPDVNLQHIEEFKVSEEDECFIFQGLHWSSYGGREMFKEQQGTKCPLEIVAPLKDFDNRMKLKGHKVSEVEIPDPIVLKPVVFKHWKHYLVVTAWGIEAEDDLVV